MKTFLKLLVIYLLHFPLTSSAQVKYVQKKINDHVYVFTELWNGSNNANVGVIIGEKGVLLVNTLMTKSAPSLENEIKKITNKPVRYIINSDSDPYNHHANAYFLERGATVFSQENLQYSTATTQILFKKQLELNLGTEVIIVYKTPSHQLNHVDVFLRNSNVLFTSDGFKGHWLTYSGPNGNEGVIKGINKAIALSNDKTVVVTGNTSKKRNRFLLAKKDLIRIKDKHIRLHKRVEYLYEKGETAEEIAHDKKVHEILQDLDAYPRFKKYIISKVKSMIESDFIKSIPLSLKELKNYVGVYQLNNDRTIEVVLEKGRLFAREKGAFIFELTALSKTKFDFKSNTRNDYLTFQFAKNGKVISLQTVLQEGAWWSEIIATGTYFKIINK